MGPSPTLLVQTHPQLSKRLSRISLWKHCRLSLFQLLVFCGETTSPLLGETLISWWKRRLPLSSVFTGLKKGRTVRALSEAVTKLASHEDTLNDSNMLKLHEGRCRLAEQLGPERFRGLTSVDLRAFLAMLAEESVQIPEKLMKQIMEKRVLPIRRTGGESRFADLLSVTNPLVGGRLVARHLLASRIAPARLQVRSASSSASC